MFMKKVILLAVMALFVMISCNSEGEIALDGKDNYTFTTTLTMTCSPTIKGYPQTTTSVTTQKGITEAQAKSAAESLTNTTTTTSGGYRFTSTWKCVYVLTKNYVAPTGARVVI
jgi:hypothetical protein